MSSRSLDLKRSTASVAIDHCTIHFARNVVSVHVLEKNADGEVVGGQDIDGVSVAEIGGSGDVAAAISGNRLVAFVQNVAGVPAKLDELPPAPVEEKAPESSGSSDAAAPAA